jgi:hypothetical protein
MRFRQTVIDVEGTDENELLPASLGFSHLPYCLEYLGLSWQTSFNSWAVKFKGRPLCAQVIRQ